MDAYKLNFYENGYDNCYYVIPADSKEEAFDLLREFLKDEYQMPPEKIEKYIKNTYFEEVKPINKGVLWEIDASQ